jgi:hypothetical protein
MHAGFELLDFESPMNTNFAPNPVPLLIFGLWVLWGFGLNTLGVRLRTEVDGVVISSRDIPETRGPQYSTEYILREPGGQERVYIAGPTDASLPRNLPVGTYLKKHRWRVTYERDGSPIDDFPLFFYEAMCGAALGCLLWTWLIWQDRRQLRNLLHQS